MAVISVQTKKFADLDEILSAGDDNLLIIHDGNGVKKITVKNLKQDLADIAEPLTHHGAGLCNSICRNKDLGTEVTDAQYEAIANQTFEDLFVGDYWTRNGRKYYIGGANYRLHKGDTELTDPHLLIVPETHLYTAQMNSSNITTGGYVGSAMYTTNLADAKNTIKDDFGSDHIVVHRNYLTNAVTSGYPSAGAWCDSDIELMNEEMVYGAPIKQQMSYGGTNVYTHTIDNTQVPLFLLMPELICTRTNWWLRDIVSATYFASVASNGSASDYNASNSYGVRPAFLIA